jgi:phosphate transport system substrate-binding protein
MRFVLLTAATALAVLALGGLPAARAADAKISGSGSSFVKPIMDKWVAEYAKAKGGAEINYQPQGSSAGISQMIEKAVDFGCTDAYMKKADLDKAKEAGGEVVHIPLVMGAIVPAYNLETEKPLNFTGDVLADIFMGKITKWNDPAIAKLNEGVKLPDQDISVVHRSDGSGSTNIFTSYLSHVSPEWKKERTSGTTIDWKNIGTGENGTAGVAGSVSKNKGAIGYIELTYALQNKVKFGAVKNKDGDYVLADPKSVSKAAEGFLKDKEFPADLRFNLVDAPGAGAYPISGTTWAVLYVNQKAGTGAAVADFLTWVVHDGQKYCEDMSYAPLPETLVKKIDEKIEQIKK